MTVVADRPITEIPFLDEDDVCHLLAGPKATWCGAPYDCPHPSMAFYSGSGNCEDCGRIICPECLQRGPRRT